MFASSVFCLIVCVFVKCCCLLVILFVSRFGLQCWCPVLVFVIVFVILFVVVFVIVFVIVFDVRC